jgi:hypothetical protein
MAVIVGIIIVVIWGVVFRIFSHQEKAWWAKQRHFFKGAVLEYKVLDPFYNPQKYPEFGRDPKRWLVVKRIRPGTPAHEFLYSRKPRTEAV